MYALFFLPPSPHFSLLSYSLSLSFNLSIFFPSTHLLSPFVPLQASDTVQVRTDKHSGSITDLQITSDKYDDNHVFKRHHSQGVYSNNEPLLLHAATQINTLNVSMRNN